MKKLSYAVAAFLLGLGSIKAQYKIENMSMTYGAELPDDNQKIVKLIGEANNKIYGLALKGKEDFVVKVFEAGSMKMISSNEIKLGKLDNKEVEFEEVVLLNGKLYAIGSVYNNKEKTYNLVGTSLSEDGVLGKSGTVLFEAKVAKKSDKGGFYFKQSRDEGALLVMHTCLYDKEDAVKYEVKLFDDNLKALFTNTEKVSFDDSKKKEYDFRIADFEIGAHDDVFLVVNESYRDSKKKERIENFEIQVFKSANNYTKEVIKLNVKDKEIINCTMMATNNNVLQLVGFYSSVRDNGKSNMELKGVYNATIDINTNTSTNIKFNEFDYATKVKLIGERRAKKGKDVKPLYYITHIIEKNDGGLIVLSEYQYAQVGSSAGIGPLSMTSVVYTKNEVIVTSLNPDGSHQWSNVVPKEQSAAVSVLSLSFGSAFGGGSFAVGVAMNIPLTQMGRGPEYLGHIPVYRDGQLNIIINDHIKNKGITDIEKIRDWGNYNNAVPSLFVFDDNGAMTRKDPEEAIKNELIIRPGVYYRKTAKEYIIYSSRKNKDKLGRLVMEN
jgi:hypothetical protein